uniref:Protein FAR1-RELATED SEQUENCE 5 n=1 Tax=Cajanus cajan TaxID=3821 RepID=A0A151S099_CAJCA|nr:Protein FAR1-RELATED SEQUENCE 5 [Cajanus cajan]
MLASHRKITEVQAYEIDLANDSGLRQKSTFQLMSTLAGHRANIGYTRIDVKNYLKAKRQRSMVYGEIGCLLQYFQRQLLENPSFFHAYQMDIDEQITNVFWADANMILDYGYFGDVVSLDTTYCTNRANRPLALFSGFNHYRGIVIFGATLLYDETTESFKWLFETFLEAHNQQKPQTIFTDQDQAMAKALFEVMLETRHGLCTWHLLQNGIKHLGNLMKGGSYFLRDFKKCMYDLDTKEEFEIAWNRLITDYSVHDNNGIKSVYAIKEKWASCYMKEIFTLGMRSTQLSESLNSNFKSCMNPNVDIIQFFKHFERVVEEKRYNELTYEYESLHKLAMLRYELSPILIQMAKVYTHIVFDLFQNEFKLFLASCILERNETHSLCQYVITRVNHEGSWRVSFDRASNSITCSCRKFETFGILCSHALKVFETNDVKVIPEKYIIKRWTREARNGIVHDVRGKEVEGDPILSSTRRYKQLVFKFVRLAADVSTFEEYHKIVDNNVDVMCKEIQELRLQAKSTGNHNNDNLIFVSDGGKLPKGFKHKPGLKRNKRLEGWVELQSNRKKKLQVKSHRCVN